MSRREFPLLAIRRADAGPTQRGHRIVCSACREVDHVINSGGNKILPSALVEKRFATAGWVVGDTPETDLCPGCAAARAIARKSEKLPMVKSPVPCPSPRSADAILAGKVAYDLMFEALDFDSRRYLDGWSDDRIAAESKLSLKAVVDLRKERFFDLAPAPEPPDAILRRGIAGDLTDLRAGMDALAGALRTVKVTIGDLERDLRALHAAEQKLLAAETSLAGHVGGKGVR